MAASDARPIAHKNAAYRVTFPILDADGDLVTGAASLDSEISKDGGTFADCTNEATEIATSSGMYYLDLTSTEMNADTVAIIVKTGTAGAKTTPLVIYPLEDGDWRVNVVQFGGAAGTFAGGRPEVNASHVGGTSQTGRDLGASVLLSPGTGTGQISLSSGAVLLQATQTGVTIPTVTTLTNAPSDSSGVTTLLSRLSALRAGYLDNLSAGATALASTFAGITSLAEWLGLIAGKQTGNSTARTELRATGAGSGTYDETTDALEAVRDRGDAAWTTATGFSTLDAGGVRTAVGLATANLDTQLSGLATAAALTTVDGVVDAIKAVTDKVDDTLEDDAGIFRFTTNALEQAPTGGSAPSAADIADAVWDEAQAGHVTGGSFGEIATEIAAILVDTAEIGAAGAGLTNIGAVGSVTGDVGGNVTGTIGGFATAAKAEIQTEAEDALIAHNLDHLVKSAVDTDFATTVHADSVVGYLADNGAGFDRTTDSLEAIRDRGDAAWTGGGEGGTDWTADERTAIRSILGVPASGTTPEDPTAGILDTIRDKVDVVDDYVDTEVAAIKAKTDQLTFTTANRVDSTVADKSGFSLSSAGIQALWDALTSALSASGSIGKLLVDNINATISSRSTYDGSDTSGTTTLLSRLSAQRATNLDNLDAAVSSRAPEAGGNVAAIKAKTDNLPASPAATSDIPSAATIADVVWDEATAGHTTAGTFGEQVKTDVDAILEDTAVIGAAGAGLTGIPWNANWDAEIESEVADALEATIADSIPADGTRPSVKQGIYMLTQFMLERSVSSTTVTVKKPDGSTALFTLTLDDATTPTSITRAT